MYRLKYLLKHAHKWTEKFHWQLVLYQQLINVKPVRGKGESNSNCLPDWSVDSHTICSSWSALFTTETAENGKASRILLLICFFTPARVSLEMSWTHPVSPFSSDSSCPFHYISLYQSSGVEPWGIVHLAYSKERSDPFFCSHSMCVLIPLLLAHLLI